MTLMCCEEGCPRKAMREFWFGALCYRHAIDQVGPLRTWRGDTVETILGSMEELDNALHPV